MSIVLDLVVLAIKEVMRKRNIVHGKSVDIDEVLNACSNMKEVETSIISNIQTEIEVVKQKTQRVQDLISLKIFPVKMTKKPIQEFIEKWHKYNKRRWAGINLRNEQINLIHVKSVELYERAQKMLSPKNYNIVDPSVEEIRDLVEFYENLSHGNTQIAMKDDKLNFSWLVEQLSIVLPAIVDYTSNFTVDPHDSSRDELKVLKRHSIELQNFETKRIEFNNKFKLEAPKIIARLKKAWEDRKNTQDGIKTTEEIAEESASYQADVESLKILASPKYYFDTSKECLKHVVVKKNRLALLGEDDENDLGLANETKYFGSAKKSFNLKQNSTMNQSKKMGPPKPRRRLDAMELLDGALSSRPNMNATSRFSNSILKRGSSDMKFSSTLLSPDLRTGVPVFDCSLLSDITKGSPMLNCDENTNSPIQQTVRFQPTTNFNNFFANLNVGKAVNPNLDDPLVLKALEKSPKGKLQALVKTEHIFTNNPKLLVNDQTAQEISDEDETILQDTLKKTGETMNGSDSFKSMMIPNDENLFNISDTLLKDVE
jgi:hypothetical protein